MTVFILVLAILFFVACLTWIKTGRSPFLWGAHICLFLEAVRVEAWDCMVPASKEFARRVRIRYALVKTGAYS